MYNANTIIQSLKMFKLQIHLLKNNISNSHLISLSFILHVKYQYVYLQILILR